MKVVTTPEPFDAALGVNYPLFAGVEGVAIAAHFYAHGRLGGPGMEHVAAGAGYHRVEELWVGISFHYAPATSTGYTLTRRRPFRRPLEFHLTVDLGEQGIIAAQAYVDAGANPGAALPHQNGAAAYYLSAVPLDAETLGVAVSTVVGAASGFLVGHYLISPVMFRRPLIGG